MEAFTLNPQSIKLLTFLSFMALAPAFMLMISSFTRFIVVLGFLKQGIGFNGFGSSQVVAALALFLSVFVMTPTISTVYENAYKPYAAKEISQEKFFSKTKTIFESFMLKHTNKDDLTFLKSLRKQNSKEIEKTSFSILAPAFLISELKKAFMVGILLLIPFLVIDFLIVFALNSMELSSFSPTLISLPLKLLLFVAIDGWQLVLGSLTTGFL